MGASEAHASLYCISHSQSKRWSLLLLPEWLQSSPDSLPRDPHPLPASPRPASQTPLPLRSTPGPWDGGGGSPSPPSCMAQKPFTLDFLAEEIRGQRSPPCPGKELGRVHLSKGQEKHICSSPVIQLTSNRQQFCMEPLAPNMLITFLVRCVLPR